MSTAVATERITPEQLLRMPDGDQYELVDGELVEQEMSVRSSEVEGIVYATLYNFVKAGQLGHVWTGTLGIKCFPDNPDQIRRPDVTFVSKERFREKFRKEGYLHIAPDLIVEVLSPNDLASTLHRKLEEYGQAGVKLVWVVDPGRRTVEVYSHSGREVSYQLLRETEEITGGSILPGFRCLVAEFFPPLAE